MAGGYRELGVGWAQVSGSPYGQYWTQDFGGGASAETSPLLDASHLLRTGSTIRFLANVSAAAAPQSVTLVLDGAAQAMSVALGSAAQGTRAVDFARASGCRSYHVELVDAGGTSWRYPGTGELHTYGEGGCTLDLP
ncbi:MAG: hypothetical protein QM767_01705 [Anaeromyxobacter sp.]